MENSKYVRMLDVLVIYRDARNSRLLVDFKSIGMPGKS